MHKSESIKNLAVALGKAQSEIGAVKFDSTNPFLKNKYASLGAVIETTRETLQKHGLTISQVPLTNEFGTGVTTILMHSSGEFLEGDMVGQISQEKGKSAAQVAGSLVSYFRRYSLAAILNIYSDEDTDGTQSPNKSRKTAQGGNSTREKLNTPMSRKMAENQTGGKDKIRYGDCTTEVLDAKMIGITKGLNKNDITPEQRETYLLKRDAIITIKAYRKLED